MKVSDFINRFQYLQSGSPWYGPSFEEMFLQIKAEHLNQKFHTSNSLGQVVEHMIAWRKFTLEMLLGNYSFRIEIDSPEDWNKGRIYGLEDWASIQGEFKEIQANLILQLKEKEDAFLLGIVPERKFTFGHLIEGILDHDLYHLGQISMLLKSKV